MKIQEIKHNHSLTELLKVLLFALIMLAPIFSVAVRCAYVVCNKNAYQSYSGQSITNYETIEEIDIGKTYNLNANNIPYESFDSGKIIYQNPLNIETTSSTLKNAINENTYFRVYASTTNKIIEFGIEENTNINININSITLSFNYELVGYPSNKATQFITINRVIEESNNSKLDNVFEYSVSQLENDQLFNWTQQTAIYTGVHAMCSNLGITNTVVPQILVYWFLLSIIYVIIDIILKTFTTLTHMLGSKKA